jgi:hypothetical protein
MEGGLPGLVYVLSCDGFRNLRTSRASGAGRKAL